MKGTTLILNLVALGAGLFVGSQFLVGPNRQAGKERTRYAGEKGKKVKWTCSMHPWIMLDAPGKCPICNMDLIPAGEGQKARNPREVKMSEEAMKLAEIVTAPVEQRPLEEEILLYGKVSYDERLTKTIAARIGGRIDRLFIDYTGKKVEKGSRLGLLYSPELLVAQEEFLEAARMLEVSRKENSPFLEETAKKTYYSSREKLRLYGLGEDQIKEILEKGVASEHVEIRTPTGGFVIRKFVSEGDYIKTGTPLLTVASLDTVWIRLDVYEMDIGLVHTGMAVEISVRAYPGEVFKGKVSYVDPFMDEKTRTVKVRVEVPNKEGRLKPGMFVTAKAHASLGGDGKGRSGPPLAVPATAVLLTGKRAIVYVFKKSEGSVSFEGREVTVGRKAGNYYQVVSGLKPGERVVVKGAFAVDSALQLSAGISMMSKRDEIKTPQAPEVPSSFSRRLSELLDKYFMLHNALAGDDSVKSIDAARELLELLKSMKGNDLEFRERTKWAYYRKEMLDSSSKLLASGTLESARRNFHDLTRVLIRVLKRYGTGKAEKIYVLFCPMAFGNKGARWLQPARDVLNPYYGKRMLKCGEVEEVLPGVEGDGK